MARDGAEELLRDSVVPVILGNGIGAHLFSARLYFRYGVRSVVCGGRQGFLDAFNPFCDFLRLYSRDARLVTEQLLDLHDGGEELIMPLVSLSEDYTELVRDSAELLESRYILCRDVDIDRLLGFGNADKSVSRG